MFTAYIESPIGFVIIKEQDNAICSINFSDEKPTINDYTELLELAKNQLNDYFKGTLKTFTFPTKQIGTSFQQNVWQTLATLNYAEVISYTQLANKMNNLLAIRAIASTNGKNKIMIAIPCHRVIGKNGNLTGYAGKIWRKKWLLDHEAKVANYGQSKLDL